MFIQKSLGSKKENKFVSTSKKKKKGRNIIYELELQWKMTNIKFGGIKNYLQSSCL